MKEDGFLYGGFASITAIVQSNMIWNLSASLAGGTLRYDGQTMDGEPVALNTPNRLFSLRTSVGYRWNLLTPFAGLGVRYWHDNLGAFSASGYNRQTTYLYSPFGLEISKTFGNAWTLGARGEFDWFWIGFNRNTDFPLEGNDTLDLRQPSGYGALLAAFLKHPVTRALRLTVEPFFQYWNIGESDPRFVLNGDGIYEFFEPANETSLIGLRGSLCW